MNDVVTPEAIAEVVQRTLAEDVDVRGDATSRAVIPAGTRGRATLVARAPGVLAGVDVAAEVFRQVDPALVVTWRCADGDRLERGTVIAEIEGPVPSLLTAERSALNLLSHCSGVATLTGQYVDVAAGRTVIRDTRKTTPGLRLLEKAAVRAGGGENHRMSLSDAVLIKDNHLAHASIADAVARARVMWPDLIVEVECDTIAQVREARDAKADLVLLDNMSPSEVATAVAELADVIPAEVSGGVTLATLDAYAEARPTYISVGAITHSAPILDLALDFDTAQ
ncbi:MAG: carboxylating nicotinate-nucleotide diphosphorylase [Acidimicrobiia bacterium]